MGNFLKILRKDKGLTQEELAEILYVSNRTISRWEGGRNMPDIEILMTLADFYEIDLVDILNGERKDKEMNKNMEETTLRVSEYEKEIASIVIVAARVFMTVCLLGLVINHFLYKLAPGLSGKSLSAVEFTMGFFDGFTMGTLILGILYTFGFFSSDTFYKFTQKFKKAD